MDNNKKKTLVIVDFQYDFCDKKGSLYVPGAEDALDAVLKAIRSGEYDRVIATLDWHTMEDKSFSVNGGQWPVHCVQYTEGAGIDKRIIEAVFEMGKKMDRISLEYFFKGENAEIEEYGAFGYKVGENPNTICVSGAYEWRKATLLDRTVKYDICGLAGDYCVWQTYKNMVDLGLDVTPLYNGISFIGEPFDYGNHE